MRIEGVIWLRTVVEKLAYKHHVDVLEVEEALSNKPAGREALILSARDMARSERKRYVKK